MKKWIIAGFLAVGLTLVLSQANQPVTANQNAPLENPTASELTAGEWNQISGGEGTICSRGTDYSFFVRPGDAEKVMIHFQGGGACWNGVNCPQGPMQTFDDSVVEDELVDYNQGLFDVDNPENPVADYTSVVVTYCTADIHVGDAVVQHGDAEIHHNGRDNAEAVLKWVYENYPNPTDVFVNGCSAGSYGSIFFAPQVAMHYPDAQFSHLGDAGVGVLVPDFDGLVKWGFFDILGEYFPELADLDPADFTGKTLYEAATAMLPEKQFTQYTTIDDEVQRTFYLLMGGDVNEWSPNAMQFLSDLSEITNFASFTAAGELHCIIPFPELYDYETNGVRLVDWISALVAGEDVETVALSE